MNVLPEHLVEAGVDIKYNSKVKTIRKAAGDMLEVALENNSTQSYIM